MKLSKRLELVASMVDDNSNIIDVGCDHAYLSIYLAKTLKNINSIEIDKIMYLTGGALAIILSSISGYVFFNLSSMTMAIIILTLRN